MVGRTAHAFSGSLRKARWGIKSEFDTTPVHGADQQLRYTFDPSFSQDHAFLMTVKILQEMTSRYTAHPEVVQFTRRLFNNRRLENHDELGEIYSIVEYFQGTHTTQQDESNMGKPLLIGDLGSYRYQKDPYGHELFISPPKVLRDIQVGESGADCDDIAAACACALAAAGYPVMLMIVDAAEQSPGTYNHVMLATKTLGPNEVYGHDWFPVELIHPLRVGQSVNITQYIPLVIEPYDLDKNTMKLIPDAFR
jgi:hypothetical protein